MNIFNPVPLPFEYSRFIGVGSYIRKYFDVKFTKDFGIFKKGETYASINIDLLSGEMKAYENREPVAMQEVVMVLTPINF